MKNTEGLKPVELEKINHEIKICFLAYFTSDQLRALLPLDDVEFLCKWVNANYIDEDGLLDIDCNEWVEIIEFEELMVKSIGAATQHTKGYL